MINIGYDYYNPENLPSDGENARLVTIPRTTYDLVLASVTEFHQKTGQYIAPDKVSSPPDDVATLRLRLIAEEREELLKEICDLAYVYVGGDIEYYDEASREKVAQLALICEVLGMNFREAFKRVHENNLGRITQDDGTIQRREDGKIIKNPSAPKVDLSDLV
jgi:predicted HAD superfamily Cof-like phosphohydrolase